MGDKLLAVWLILWGQKAIFGPFYHEYHVLGVLALVTAVLLIVKR